MCPLMHVSRTNLIFFAFRRWWTGHSKTHSWLYKAHTSILTSVLQSTHGVHLGRYTFAKIQTTLWMCMLCCSAILEKWVEDGKFNPERMAENDYSHSMAILVILSPNAQGTALESAGIGLVICRHRVPIGHRQAPFLFLSSMLTPCWKWKDSPHSWSIGYSALSWITTVACTWHLPWILHSA